LKERPEIRSRIDTRTAIRSTRFEGSASDVLRDVLITTSNMAEEIKNKRIVLQESLKNDDELKESIKNDNAFIIDYFKESSPIPEIKKSY
jgi:phosphoenolpyruvate carboxylase